VAARAKGRLLGRPKGSLGNSKLDDGGGDQDAPGEAGFQGIDRQDRGFIVDQPPSLDPDPKTRPEGPGNPRSEPPLKHILEQPERYPGFHAISPCRVPSPVGGFENSLV
jgi:hypothetical protein